MTHLMDRLQTWLFWLHDQKDLQWHKKFSVQGQGDNGKSNLYVHPSIHGVKMVAFNTARGKKKRRTRLC